MKDDRFRYLQYHLKCIENILKIAKTCVQEIVVVLFLGRSVQYGGPSLLRKRRSNRNSDRTNEGHDGKSRSDGNSDDPNGDQTRTQNQNGKANNVRQILIENH